MNIYRLKHSSRSTRRYWFIGSGPMDIWVWDMDNQTGIGGHKRTFQIGASDEAAVTVRGPWMSNPQALFEETGIDMRTGSMEPAIAKKVIDQSDG